MSKQTAVRAKKFVVIKYFEGLPKRDDFELVVFDMPSLKENEILVKSEWISIDRYVLEYSDLLSIPYVYFGYQVGTVIDTKNPGYPIGTKVVSHEGWCDHFIINPDAKVRDLSDKVLKLPNLKGLPLSYSLSIVGLQGFTAYFGLMDICKPKKGETIVVSGASGVVGSLVGQMAKIQGCKVIGLAGSNEKVEILEKEMAFDKVINYKTADVATSLKIAAPRGIDCYFDTIGGSLSAQVIYQMRKRGRIAVCGSLTMPYEEFDKIPAVADIIPGIFKEQLTMKGFLVTDYLDKYNEAIAEIIQWVKEDKIKVKERVIEGFENLYDALLEILKNRPYGRTLMKL